MKFNVFNGLYPLAYDTSAIDNTLIPMGVVTTSDQISAIADAGATPGGQVDQTTADYLSTTAQGLDNLASLHTTLLQGQGLIATGTAGDTVRQNPIMAIGRPWVEQPDNSDPFDFESAVALPAIGASGTVVTLTVPPGYDGVINAFSWNFLGGGFTQNSGDIQVQLLRNGAAIRNYDNILVEKGTIQVPRQISALRIYSNQTITMIVNHIANNTLNGNVVGSFVGYFYPSLG